MKKLLGCIFLMGLFLVPIKAESSSETKVVLNFTEESRFILTVNVNEGGTLHDGEQKIENGTVTYEMSLNSEKVFRITPKLGYRIKHVWYQRPELPDMVEVTHKIKDNELRIDVESTEMILTVEFEKIPEEIASIVDEENADSSTSVLPADHEKAIEGINTGDHAMTTWYGFLICISGVILILMYIRKKKDSYDTRNV